MQAGRNTERQTNRQAGRKSDSQTDRQECPSNWDYLMGMTKPQHIYTQVCI